MITGAGAGIGRATSEAFARRGARIGLVARGRERLEAARADVEKLGGRGLVLVADVADENAVEAAAERLEIMSALEVMLRESPVHLRGKYGRNSGLALIDLKKRHELSSD